jgi:hypothetical protein
MITGGEGQGSEDIRFRGSKVQGIVPAGGCPEGKEQIAGPGTDEEQA